MDPPQVMYICFYFSEFISEFNAAIFVVVEDIFVDFINLDIYRLVFWRAHGGYACACIRGICACM